MSNTSRVIQLVCLVCVVCIALFAVIDAVLEAYFATAAQMLVRLVLVASALVAAVAVIISLVHRMRISQEEVRFIREQDERRVQSLHEQARLLGALVVPSPGGSTALPPAPEFNVRVLTRRERDVAILIAQGRTSREIADALVITERTADTHADRIRTKLRLHSRAEIVAWMLQQNGSAP